MKTGGEDLLPPRPARVNLHRRVVYDTNLAAGRSPPAAERIPLFSNAFSFAIVICNSVSTPRHRKESYDVQLACNIPQTKYSKKN